MPSALHTALSRAGFEIETVYGDNRIQLAAGESKDPMPVIFSNVPTPPPAPPSAGQILTEQLDQIHNDGHVLALQAYNNWASLTLGQKDTVLKFLLGYYLSSAQRLGYFRLP